MTSTVTFSEKIRQRFQQISIARFNRICFVTALLWLLLTIPAGILLRPTSPDFSQFYLGGIIAQKDQWPALYPIPYTTVLDNAGLWMHSDTKPHWESIRDRTNAPDDTRFILPPPSALLFVPFSLFSNYDDAFWVWTFILIGCTWGVALVAGRINRHLMGRPSRIEGLLALLIVLSPMTARAIRIANVSPPIALAIGLALLGLIRRDRPVVVAFSIFIGAMLKYATLVLAPLLLAMRQWRTVAWLAVFGISTTLLTLTLAGPEIFLEFYRIIVPTLARPSAFQGNQSLPGLLVRIFGRPLPENIQLAANIARFGSLLAILALAFRIPTQDWKKPVTVVVGATLLLSWLMIFSPIAWEHWPIFLCPVWGWLLMEARSSGSRRIVAALSLVLMALPAGIFQVEGFLQTEFRFSEPLNSWQLIAFALTAKLAFWRLAEHGAEALPLDTRPDSGHELERGIPVTSEQTPATEEATAWAESAGARRSRSLS